MIRTQLKDLNLNRDQKEFVEISANQALRFNQQLNDLRQKLKQHISGVTGVCKSSEYMLN
jgi:coenzyme F420-reducing hydrogenase delta subunit